MLVPPPEDPVRVFAPALVFGGQFISGVLLLANLFVFSSLATVLLGAIDGAPEWFVGYSETGNLLIVGDKSRYHK